MKRKMGVIELLREFNAYKVIAAATDATLTTDLPQPMNS